MTDVMEKLIAQIQKIQQREKLSNAEFANRLGINPATLSHLYSGRNKPSLSIIEHILREFPDVSADALLRGIPSTLAENPSPKESKADLFKQPNQVKEPTVQQESFIEKISHTENDSIEGIAVFYKSGKVKYYKA